MVKRFLVQFVVLIALGFVFVESKPARGENEGFTSDGEPPRVAEADKTSHFIAFNDVLTNDEKAYLRAETQSKGIFYLLKKDSQLTDLSENFLGELASSGKCAKDMETLNRCLENRKEGKTEKVTIDTIKVSKTRKTDVKQVEIKDSEGETFLVDEDCTNNQITLEECIIANNRYHPCTPPQHDLTQYKKLFEERSRQFAGIIKKAGFELKESSQSFEFGTITGYEVLNYNETYETHVKSFLATLPANKLSEPYESLKNDFAAVQANVPANSLNFNKYKEAFRVAACKREVLSVDDTMKTILAAEKKFKKPSNELKAAFQKFRDSLTLFLDKSPKEVLEKCVDEKEHQSHIENKVKILDLFKLRC